MQYETTMSAGPFVGLLHVAPKKDVRFYLNGLHCAPTPCGKRLMIEATDGHILARIATDEIAPPAPFIVPRDLIEKLRFKKSDATKSIGIVVDGDQVQLFFEGSSVAGRLVEGTFPNTNRVIPWDDPKGEPAQFNPDLLVRLKKCADALGASSRSYPHVAHNGDGNSARVFFDGVPDMVSVVMPVRTTDPLVNGSYPVQEWERSPKTEPQSNAA